MKKLLLILGIIFYTIGFAQTDEQKKILQDTQTFATSFENKDYDAILQMSYPPLLEQFDKKTLISVFKATLEGNDNFSIKIKNASPDLYEVSEVFRNNDKSKFAFVSFPMVMEMSFLQKKLDESMKNLIINTMQQQGMKANFINDNTILIEKLSLTLAINDKATKHTWKYLNHDENNPLYTKIVSKDIIKKAKEYYAELLQKQDEEIIAK
ncbi:MAG: hypothetical protein Q4G16_00665 [Cruoricaptor ignavus]|nr:hypothetical protein [Cruoricaptor ignavus]